VFNVLPQQPNSIVVLNKRIKIYLYFSQKIYHLHKNEINDEVNTIITLFIKISKFDF